jgi:hypothetical protein
MAGLGALLCCMSCGVDDREFNGNAPDCPSGTRCAEQAGLGAGAGKSPGSSGATAAAGPALPGLAGAGGGAGSTSGGGGTAPASLGGSEPLGGVGGSEAAGAGGTPGAPGAIGGPSAAIPGGPVSTCGVAQLLTNGGFEAGSAPWSSFTTGQDELIYDATLASYDGVAPRGGSHLGWLGGVANEINRLSQTVTLPEDVVALSFTGSMQIQVFEQHAPIDFVRITLVVPDARLALLAFGNGDAGQSWVDIAASLDVASYAGQEVTLELESQIGDGPGTNFFLDDLSLVPACEP